MTMNKVELPEGYECLGLRVRIYPSPDQILQLRDQQRRLRRVWNWLVSRQEEVIAARVAYCKKRGLISDVPRPEYNGMTPEEAKEAKRAYREACAQNVFKTFDLTKDVPECAWRPRIVDKAGVESEATRLSASGQVNLKHDYQVLNWYLKSCGEEPLGAHVLQSLYKQFMAKVAGQKRKKHRRFDSDMPLKVRSGLHLKICSTPYEWVLTQDSNSCDTITSPVHRYQKWHEVGFPGLKGKIRAKIDRKILNRLLEPGVSVFEGMTITEDVGEWYASFTVRVRVRAQVFEPDTYIGLDPGLDNFIATSRPITLPGTQNPIQLVKNKRNLEHNDRIAHLQQLISEAVKNGVTDRLANLQFKLSRAHQKARRYMKDLSYRIAKALARFQFIGIEENHGCAVGVGSRYTSSTNTLQIILTQKYKDRLRVVESYHNSQDCSQCGFNDKPTWSREPGKGLVCTCKQCGNKMHRDINAANNIEKRTYHQLLAA